MHRGDDVFVELSADVGVELLERMRRRHRRAIRTASDHGVEAIRDGDDARMEVEVFRAQFVGIALAVEPLVVAPDDRSELGKA